MASTKLTWKVALAGECLASRPFAMSKNYGTEMAVDNGIGVIRCG